MTALLDLAAEVRRELTDAVYVVRDPHDEHLLHRLDLRGALHVPHDGLYGHLLGHEAEHVVLCAGTDPRLAGWLGLQLPDVTVRVLSIDSPVLALGVREMPETWNEVETLRNRWLDLAAEHSRLADLQREIERVEVPAMLTTTKKLKLRGARR